MGETTIDKGPPKDMGLTGMGRAELEGLVLSLRAQLVCAQKETECAHAAAAWADRERFTMEGTLTATQAHCSRQLQELRLYRGNDMIDPLIKGIAIAREKHPKGSALEDLVDELGEVAAAIRDEGLERVRDELLDVAIVALRMRAGECRRPLVENGDGR